MKRINFVSVVFIAVLMVLAISCTPLQESMGGYETAPGTGRVYRSVPYGSQQVIVVERDPFTGQYYQASPYGYYGGSPYQNQSYGYDYGYPRRGQYRGATRGSVRPTPRQQPQQPVRPQRENSRTTQRAKDIIRGN